MVNVRQNHLKELVGQNRAPISEPKEGVVSEDSGQGHGAGMQDPLMAEGTEGSMSMYNADTLPDEDLPQYREGCDQGRQGHLIIEGLHWEVVDLDA